MLRLTLRTLLAYLDDTLEPAQAKDIGKKVAESEVARETVERIKTVTRRRRLSAPPVLADDHSTDPNTIAEYLDNVLAADQVTQLEESALENDVRLAEVAACHQILTLVLGEPAKVPPTASRRMYRLVKGPESLPYRQPTAASAPVAGVAAPAEVDEFQDHEDDLLGTFLGPRRVLWLVGLLIAFGLLAISVWLAIPPAPPQPVHSYVVVLNRPEPAPAPIVPAKIPETTPKKETIALVEPPPPPFEPDLGPVADPTGKGPNPIRGADTDRRPIGVVDPAPTPQPLLFLRRETIRWEKVDPAAPRIQSTDSLVALPGFHPEIRLDSGVHLQLWGSAPDFLPLPLAETRLVLLVPPTGFDADVELKTGRVFVTAPKMMKPAVVRFRFREEVWDITIGDEKTEVAIDVYSEPAKGPLFDRAVIESPRTVAYLGVIEGKASIRIGFRNPVELDRGDKWKWDSKGERPGPAPKDDKDEAGVPNRWTKQVPATPTGQEMAAASTQMALRVSDSHGPFDVEFNATLKDTTPNETVGRRVISTWMLASVIDTKLTYLIDAVESDSAPVRDAAARALQHWVAQDPKREELYKQELALKVMFSGMEQDLLVSLVRGVERPIDQNTAEELFRRLAHERLAVRELARMQLAKIDPHGQKESNYDAGLPAERHRMQAETWRKSWTKRNAKMK